MKEPENTRESENLINPYKIVYSYENGKNSFNKELFILVISFFSFLLFIFAMLIPDGSSGDFYPLLAFRAFILLGTIYCFHHYFHVVREVRIDEENLSIRKFKTFKIDKWEHIKYVRAHSTSTGFTYIWIKRKKGAPKLSTRYFSILIFPPGEKQGTELLYSMLSNIRKNTELKYNRNI